jgi:hypothetical protein
MLRFGWRREGAGSATTPAWEPSERLGHERARDRPSAGEPHPAARMGTGGPARPAAAPGSGRGPGRRSEVARGPSPRAPCRRPAPSRRRLGRGSTSIDGRAAAGRAAGPRCPERGGTDRTASEPRVSRAGLSPRTRDRRVDRRRGGRRSGGGSREHRAEAIPASRAAGSPRATPRRPVPGAGRRQRSPALAFADRVHPREAPRSPPAAALPAATRRDPEHPVGCVASAPVRGRLPPRRRDGVVGEASTG